MSGSLVKRIRQAQSGKGRTGKQIVVVESAPMGGAGGVRKKRKPRARPGTFTGDDAYKYAMRTPFSDLAIGARLPDPFGVPTIPVKMETRCTIVTNGSGRASGIISVPLHMSLWMGSGSVTAGSLEPALSNTNFLGMIPCDNYSSLANQFIEYRVVACGVEFVNLVPPTTATGRLTMATIPGHGPVPGPNLLTTSVVLPTDVFEMYTGLSLQATGSGDVTDQILSLPTGETFTMQELITTPAAVNLRPCGADAFDWVNPTNQADFNTTLDYGLSTGMVFDVTGAPPVWKSTDHPTVINSGRGWNTLWFVATGLPLSTPALELRLIYHVEGFPALRAGSFQNAAACRPVIGRTPSDALDAVLGAAKDKAIRIVSEKGGELARSGISSLMDLISTKIGLRL